MALTDVFTALGLDRAPAGVLWDMDGTIIDTETEWARYSQVVVERHGGVWDADDDAFVTGASTADHAGRLAEAVLRGGKKAEPMDLFAELAEELRTEVFSDVEFLPGVLDLIGAFADAGIPQSLVTATQLDLVEPVLEALKPLELNAVVTGSDDVPGKPDPGPYRLGAQRLGVDIDECIAFEDSPTGLASAHAAGTRTFSVAEVPLADLAKLI